MKIIEKKLLSTIEKEALLQLWNTEYPERLSHAGLEELKKYLEGLNNMNHYLLYDTDNSVKAWAYVFDRGGERFFAIILSEDVQGKGYGKLLINSLKSGEKTLNIWIIDNAHTLKNSSTCIS